MGAIREAGTAYSYRAPELTHDVSQSLGLCVVFCRSLFVSLSFFFWPLSCLSLD